MVLVKDFLFSILTASVFVFNRSKYLIINLVYMYMFINLVIHICMNHFQMKHGIYLSYIIIYKYPPVMSHFIFSLIID